MSPHAIPAETEPCAQCGQPHPWSPQRGYEAADGHPWQAATTAPHSEPEGPQRARYDNQATFGIGALCHDCNDGRLILNTPAALRTHDRWHAERESAR